MAITIKRQQLFTVPGQVLHPDCKTVAGQTIAADVREGYKAVFVGFEGPTLSVWIEDDSELPKTKAFFYVFCSGDKIIHPDGLPLEHVQSVQHSSGMRHVYTLA